MTQKKGERVSTASAYLSPIAESRENLLVAAAGRPRIGFLDDQLAQRRALLKLVRLGPRVREVALLQS